MSETFKRLAAVMSVAVVLPVLAVAPAANAATSTVLVTGNTASAENQPGWMFNRDTTTSTPFEFNKDAKSIGQGSLYVKPIGSNASDKFIGENFLQKPLSDITSISYDFQLGSGLDAAKADQFYMSVYANFAESDPLKFYDCRYSVVPTTGSDSSFTTVTFDPTQSYTVATRGSSNPSPHACPATPADMGPGAMVRVFALNVGDSSTADQGVHGYLDNVVVATSTDTTVYNFDPKITMADKNACKNNGWKTSNSPVFKNQGECVSSFASSHNSLLSFLYSLL